MAFACRMYLSGIISWWLEWRLIGRSNILCIKIMPRQPVTSSVQNIPCVSNGSSSDCVREKQEHGAQALLSVLTVVPCCAFWHSDA